MRSQTSSLPRKAILLCCLIATSRLLAQDNKSALSPHEPLLPRAPEMAAWIITYQYPPEKKHGNKKDSKGSRDRITSVQIEKTGDTYHKVTHWENGKQSDEWSIRGREVIQGDADSKYVPTPADGPAADDYTKSDFEDLGWLETKYFAGLNKGAHAEFVFRTKRKDRPPTRREKSALEAFNRLHPKSGDTGPQQFSDGETIELMDQSPETEETILLDATTQLPVEYDQGSVKWTYQFTQAPKAALEPPAEVNTLLEHWDNFIKSSETSGSPP